MLSKIKMLGVAGLTAVAVAGGTATAAFAGDSPYPSPSQTETVSPNFGIHPTPHVVVRQRPAQFDIQLSTIGTPPNRITVNRLVESGPFATGVGTDITLSNTLDRFTRPGGSLLVRHTGLGAPTVNRATCTVTYDQTGLWSVNGPGTGNAANIVNGHGTFRLVGLLSVNENARGQCPLPLNTARAAAYAQSHAAFSDFAVQGAGTLGVRVTLP
jgi:hypothetical protein